MRDQRDCSPAKEGQEPSKLAILSARYRESCPEMSGIDRIRKARGVPARRGQRVRVDGKPGRITSAAGGYLKVRFDDRKFSVCCHPTWRFEYEVDGKFVAFGMD